MKIDKRSFAIKLFSLLLLFGLLLGTYLVAIRPGQLHCGATKEEWSRSMPGDEIVSHPSLVATRAVTIEGTPEEIWPWLVQMGYGRAGFNGYDLVENLGSQRGIRSAERPDRLTPSVRTRCGTPSLPPRSAGL